MAQERVLRILAQQEAEEMGQRRLQELLGVQSGSLSELVGKLEDKGFLVRIRNEADKRNVTLKLTEAGRARAAHPSDHPDPFAALSEAEQAQLRALLQKVLESQEKNRRSHAGKENLCS